MENTHKSDGERSKRNSAIQDQRIDFGLIFQALSKHKRTFYKVLPVVFVVACLYALSIPNYYNSTVKLAPELTSSGGGSSLMDIASSFGIQLGNNNNSGGEALFPTLYPDLMNSVDFKTDLFSVKVREMPDDDGKQKEEITYFDYLLKKQKKIWWKVPITWVKKLFTERDTMQQNVVNPFQLTKTQTEIVEKINQKVNCDVDKKTLVITIDVTDQDPLVAATMADSVKNRLQDFITEYRTNKARNDLEYTQKIYLEAKRNYDKSRKLYAEFVDQNQDIILESVRSKQTDLENEMQLQFNIYNSLSAQLQSAKAKVQEITPAFTVLQSATVPIKKSGPKRALIVLAFLFLAVLVTSGHIFYKEDLFKYLVNK